jgi:polar amino acid transport system substrate-binding protein
LRRYAPRGGYFADSDRAAGIFGSIGTLFSVLLALVIFLSVEKYTETQSHTNAEADSVLEQFQLAELFPSRNQYSIQSQLVCYGRSVRDLEWPVQSDLRSSPVVEYWAGSINAATDAITISGPRAEAGYQLFLQQTLERQSDRRGRLEGAAGALPGMVWPILVIGAIAIVAHLVAYADSRERMASQAFQVGIVTFLLSASLLLINALDHPFSATPGKILPDKMQRSVEVMQEELTRAIDAPNLDATLPCAADGTPAEALPLNPEFPSGSTMDQIVQRGSLTVGVSYNIALFGELDPLSGVVSGFDNELVKEIAREMGFREDQIEFVDILPEERLPALQEGRVDLVVMAITITEERRQIVDFSRPYYIAGQTLLVRRNNRSIGGLRDLAGREVCVIATSTSIPALTERAPQAVLATAPSPGACLDRLLSGQVEVMSTDDIILAGFAAENDGLVLVGGKFTAEPYGVGVPKGKNDMVAFVDSVIDRLIDDGRWGRIYYEYLADIPGLPSVHEARGRLIEERR